MTRRLALIFFILLMDVIGISVLYPVTAYLVRRHGGDAQMVTLLTAAYAAAQFVAAPVLGALGDRFGRRPVLLVSVTGSAVGYVIFGVGGALWVLFLSRLIDGVTAALCALSAILGFCFLLESLPVERRERRPLRLSNLNPFVAIGRMVRRPGLGWPLLALCLV